MNRFALLSCTGMLLLASEAMAIGAIAVDKADPSKEPAYGFSINQPSRQKAEKVAVQFCREYGGEDCRAIVWFQTCGAYANSTKYYGYGFGATKAKATSDALAMCGRNSCEVVVAECE